MPFTVAHAAAAVPLHRALGRRAVLSALVIGSIVPDFWYFLPFHLKRADTHTLGGLLWFCLPVGLATYVLYHALMKRPWLELLPQPVALRLGGCAAPGLPRARWSAVLASLALGAATHLVWDALTHDGPFVERALPALDAALFSIGPYQAYGYSLLQHLSTAAGLALLAFWLLAWYRSARPGPQAARRLSRTAAVALLVAIGAATAWIAISAAAVAWERHLPLAETRTLAKLAFGHGGADAPSVGRLLQAVLLAGALAGAAGGALPADAPRLASLDIDIWPEYDRPHALVILKGVLDPQVRLPATLSLRIPAAAGAPSAVAYADASGNLFNLRYESEAAGEFARLRLTTPERAFHVEFYEPIASSAADREYRYVWPGDLAVAQLGVRVKEPAAASDVSVQPELVPTGTSADGLRTRAARFGALAAGVRLPIAVRYTKADARASTEILGARAAPPSPPAAAVGWSPALWVLAAALGGLLLGAAAVLLLRHRR